MIVRYSVLLIKAQKIITHAKKSATSTRRASLGRCVVKMRRLLDRADWGGLRGRRGISSIKSEGQGVIFIRSGEEKYALRRACER